MAQRVITHLIDDLDGGEATGTVTFGYMGRTYEIDLSDKNSEKLGKALSPFMEKARTVGGSKTRNGGVKTRAQSASEHKRNLAEVRAWARENGHEVSERGRISGEIMAAYDAANA